MTKCPVCRDAFGAEDFPALARHLFEEAEKSNAGHVRWLNQSITRRRIDPLELESRLRELYSLGSGSLGQWIRQRFIRRFFGTRPHPFVLALQRPGREVLLGYVLEHQHFLRQWVRSCAFILARTDQRDVTDYEIDNIRTEFGGEGPNHPSHYELLLRMGESYGVSRETILSTPPLLTTARTLGEWNDICAKETWVEAMAAMHSLELIAHRGLRGAGATVPYFDPAILSDGSISGAAVSFLREGYEADVGHSDRALALVERYSNDRAKVEAVQSTFLRSVDLFDDYLGARLERAESFS